MVLAILGILVAIVMPSFTVVLRRGKVEGVATETGMLMQRARYEAIRRGAPIAVEVQYSDASVSLIVDVDRDGVPEYRTASVFLPPGIEMRGPGETEPAGPEAVVGFAEDANGGRVIFDATGAADAPGAFRLGDGFGNLLEVRVDPPATGHLLVRKWDAADGVWREENEDGGWTWY